MALLTAAGAQAAADYTKWPGGEGVISIVEPDAASGFGVGAYNGATVIMEVSFDGGHGFVPMTLNGAPVIFDGTLLTAKRFACPGATIRANVTGTPSGVGILLGINGTGQ